MRPNRRVGLPWPPVLWLQDYYAIACFCEISSGARHLGSQDLARSVHCAVVKHPDMKDASAEIRQESGV